MPSYFIPVAATVLFSSVFLAKGGGWVKIPKFEVGMLEPKHCTLKTLWTFTVLPQIRGYTLVSGVGYTLVNEVDCWVYF